MSMRVELRTLEPSQFPRVFFHLCLVAALDRGAPPAAVLTTTLYAVLKPHRAVLALLADP